MKLALGHDGTAAYTCTYIPDTTDKSGLTYRIASCTGDAKAGDLVGANSAEFSIVGGTNQKLQAQLAQNPVGEIVGGDIIPPMPTYWGRSDGCVPSSQTGTISTSCASQVAEGSQIVTNYFNQVNASNPAPNVIVAPVADRAIRHADALATGDVVFVPDSNDFPFHREGHMNPGGDFDAYWRLNGDLNSKNDTATGNSSAHFDADFSGHVVLFGDDVNVVGVTATVDTKSGSSPSATGSVHYFLFGQELPGGGTVNSTVGFNTSNSTTKSITVFTLEYWVFSVDVDAFATVSLKTSGTLAPTGLSVSVTPEASLGTHVIGGVNLGIASGSVDVKIELLKVTAPVTGQAGLATDTNPNHCSLSFTFALDGQVTISSLGGEIDLKATFGFCPFCDHESYTLVKWDPLLSTTQTLFHVGPLTAAATPLPLALCATTATAGITSPGSNTVSGGQSIPLTATVTTPAGPGTSTCADRQWTVVPAEPIAVSNGCQVSILFNNSGFHTLTVKATVHFTDQFGRSSSASATASRSVNALGFAPGVHITSIQPSSATQSPLDNQTVAVDLPVSPGRVQVGVAYVGTAQVQLNLWVADSTGVNRLVANPLCPPGACTKTLSWGVSQSGLYTLKLDASDPNTGAIIGTVATTKVNLTGPDF